MAMIHQRLCQSADLARIDLGCHIRELAAGLFRSYGTTPEQVTLEVEVENATLGLDTLVPCTLIVHELVSNALKHAFSDGRTGTVAIGLHPAASRERQRPESERPESEAAASKPRYFELVVRDNGKGLPAEVELRNAPTLGLQLVSALADQLEGVLEVSRDGGTRVALTFRDVRYQERG
jgi:two-component sensor histidine kinase